jgi:O-antigen/teichoic acid export membrane protein
MSVNPDEVGKNLRRNVLSNYAALGFRIARGLVGFRLLYEALSTEEFGYWALLWSIFGYGVLLDFGFGITVQKSVAQLVARQKWDELNRALSTIFVMYCGIGLLLIGVGVALQDSWLDWVEIGVANRARFGHIFTLFVGVMGVMFPLAVFPEILRGQQRIALVNMLNVASSAIGLTMICVAVWLHWDFTTIVLIAAGETLLAPVAAVFLAFVHTPTLRLSPRHFSRAELRQASRFSLVAYLIMVSYLLMTKTDLLVIGTLISVQAAALYQPGAKLAETFGMLVRQLADVMQPAAAHLYARDDRAGIRELLTNGIRFSALLATPLYLVTVFYVPWLIQLLTGQLPTDVAVIHVGQVLVLWAYGFVVTHNVYKRIAVMGGHEKKLLWVGVLEAVGNLGLSVGLVLAGWGLVGVALGTLVPAMLLGWLVLWRWSAHEAGHTYFGFARVTLLRTWLASLPLLGVLLIGRSFGLQSPAVGRLPFFGYLALVGVFALVAIWTGGLHPSERTLILARLSRPLRRVAPTEK